MAFQDVKYKKSDYIVRLILNRPEALNAINENVLNDLNAACDAIERDKGVRVVVLTGQGGVFSAGGDLTALEIISAKTGAIEELLRFSHKTFNRFEDLPVCTIASINGLALAGGLELIMCCDLAIMSQDARIGDHHANFGLIPTWGSTQRLPRILGVRKAKEIIYTGDSISPEDALNYGLINKVVPSDRLEKEVTILAKKLCEKSSVTTATMKRLINSGMQVDLRSGLEMEVSVALNHFRTDDCIEGVAAFKEKRRPRFKGR